MKNLLKISLLSILLIAMSSCAGFGPSNTQSRTSSDLRFYLGYTEWKDSIPKIIDNSVKPTKKGKACTTNIIGLFATGNSSIEEAKSNGSITKVAFVDTTYRSITYGPNWYQEGCTVIWGE